MPQVSVADWQAFVRAHPQMHLLQSAEWGELKAGFGWDVVRVLRGDIGVQILFRRLPLGLTVAYIPKAVVAPAPDSAGLWAEVDALCAQRGAILCKLEPDRWTDGWAPDSVHWQASAHNIQPPRTILIDLRGTEDEMLARMKQKTRYNIRLAEKKGVSVRTWDDLAAFHAMLLVTGARDAFGVHASAYYRRAHALFHGVGKCELLVAEYAGRPLAALMVFAQGARAWYVYGASTDEERNRMPTYLLQWQAMRWARARGCEVYDLWGVPDEDEAVLERDFETRHTGLWGVYRFKRGFGGQVRRAAQAVDRVYRPFLYRLYAWRMAGRESV
jgi:lipid II:glycine glycyltransferase (peptidoglycan interpeptide bridge formation enzyme)